MSFQLMEGSGLPLAWHIKVTLEPSFTTISLDRLMIFGGTVKANKKWVNLINGEGKKRYNFTHQAQFACHGKYYSASENNCRVCFETKFLIF